MWLLDDAASDLTILIQIVDHNNHSHEPDLSNGLLGSSRMSGRWERAHARLRAGRPTDMERALGDRPCRRPDDSTQPFPSVTTSAAPHSHT